MCGCTRLEECPKIGCYDLPLGRVLGLRYRTPEVESWRVTREVGAQSIDRYRIIDSGFSTRNEIR